jgi:hypothetical protein
MDAGLADDLERRLPGRLCRNRRGNAGADCGTGDEKRRREAGQPLPRRCNARGERR